MSKYTYKDVIIDPNDTRIEIGAEYYYADFAKVVLRHANNNDSYYSKLVSVNAENYSTPFLVSFDRKTIQWACLIRKKEPEKKYVPFDLSKEEDRQVLRDIWIKNRYNGNEFRISAFKRTREHDWQAHISQVGLRRGYELLHSYTFLDNTPCGKLVEIEE